MISNRTVLVCHSKTCLKDGAREVLAAFEQEVPDKISLQSRPCTGECGSGPIVIVLPEEIWYSRVQPKDVPLIVRQHLRGGEPCYRKTLLKISSLPEVSADLGGDEWILFTHFWPTVLVYC
ncbi:MAG: (2Fe-2S) ferredoxin domain-containing protein [Prochlorotrichaceae cyanobacterium]|jgi:(2Fe-2S) ferredoxin